MTDLITAIIVDDELHARIALRGIIEEHCTQIRIVQEAKDIPDAVKAIHKHKPDIIFLDIEMPGYSGLSILDFFENNSLDAAIVFVTAYSEYAIQAFELAAVDYLLKPVQVEHIQRVMDRVTKQKSTHYQVLKEHIETGTIQKIALQTAEGFVFIHFNDIVYVKADGSYSHFILQNGKRITNSKRLMEYEKLEEYGHFFRIHRSHIVNIHHIVKVLKHDGGAVEMSDGSVLSISADKKGQLLTLLSQYKL